MSFVQQGGLEKAAMAKSAETGQPKKNPALSLKRLFAQLGEQLEGKGS